jgi:hypothetical protein
VGGAGIRKSPAIISDAIEMVKYTLVEQGSQFDGEINLTKWIRRYYLCTLKMGFD